MALGALPLGELVDELATLAAQISAGMCRWLELVGEFDRRETWAHWGYGTCGEWLAWRCALTPRSAREHVRVARGLAGLPLIRAAFSRGELSYAKVRALTRVAVPKKEPELLELAAALTAAQLERALRAYRTAAIEDARELHEQEKFSWHWDDDGSLVLHGRLAPEDGALLLRALDAAREGLREADHEQNRGSAEPRPEERRLTNVDALVALADTALAHKDAVRTGGDRCQIVVHLDEAALTGTDDGACTLEEGPPLAPETALRLACDATLVTVGNRTGPILDLGRKRRTVSSALRRILVLRDRGCRFPGCENHRFLDAHHIHHWAHGGKTKPENLLLLCRRHHRLLHEGGYTIDRHQRFHDRHGRPIPPVPRQPPGKLAALHETISNLDATPNTLRNGFGDRMDLGLAVHALLGIIGPKTGTAEWPGFLRKPLEPGRTANSPPGPASPFCA
jgi:hypothetical protein